MDSKKWVKLRDKCPARWEPYNKKMAGFCELKDDTATVCQKQKDCPFVYWFENFTTPKKECISGGECYEGKYCQCAGCKKYISTTE